MNDNIEGDDKSCQPPQQAQPEQISVERKRPAGRSNSSQGGGAKEGFDFARFTSGVVGVYDAFLKEPIPEEMLRLVRELNRKERK